MKLDGATRASNLGVMRDHLWLQRRPLLAKSTRQAAQVRRYDVEPRVSRQDARNIAIFNDRDNVQSSSDGFSSCFDFRSQISAHFRILRPHQNFPLHTISSTSQMFNHRGCFCKKGPENNGQTIRKTK